MLAVVILSAVAPGTGAVPADTNCPYGVCPPPEQNLLPWEIALVILVVVAVLLAVLILMRRRRGGRGGSPGPVEPWTPRGPPAGAGAEAPAPATSAAVAPAVAAVPAYLETPEDVGAPPPSVSAAAGAGGAAAAAGGAEADIDSLMQELDKISNEILKRGGPKTGKDQETNGSTEGSEGDSGSK